MFELQADIPILEADGPRLPEEVSKQSEAHDRLNQRVRLEAGGSGMSPRMVAALATASIVCTLLTTPARTQPLPGPPDTLGALLSEVRALRTTIEAVASATASGQLTLGRLQLQEQRVNGVIDRLDAIRRRITDAQRHDRYQQNECIRLEATLKDPSTLDPAVREEVERGLKACPADLAAIAAEIQELTADETTLAAQLSAEQAKWSDVNRRLEEIELTLTRHSFRAAAR